MPEVRHQKLQSCTDMMLCSDFLDGWSTVTTLWLTEEGWWDSLWRHTNACRTLTPSVLKLNVVRTALWDWLPPDRGSSWPQHSPLTSQDCLWSVPASTHLGSYLRWHSLAQAEITPESTVFSQEDNPVPGSSNVSGQCSMYGNRYSVSCLWCRLDASWVSFMAAYGRALLLALGKQL